MSLSFNQPQKAGCWAQPSARCDFVRPALKPPVDHPCSTSAQVPPVASARLWQQQQRGEGPAGRPGRWHRQQQQQQQRCRGTQVVCNATAVPGYNPVFNQPTVDKDRLTALVKLQYTVKGLATLEVEDTGGDYDPSAFAPLLLLNHYTKYRCRALEACWEEFMARRPAALREAAREISATREHLQARGLSEPAVVISVLTQDALRTMVKELCGEDALEEVLATGPPAAVARVGLEYAAAGRSGGGGGGVAAQQQQQRQEEEAPEVEEARGMVMRRRLVTTLIRWAERQPNLKLPPKPNVLSDAKGSAVNKFTARGRTMEGERMESCLTYGCKARLQGDDFLTEYMRKGWAALDWWDLRFLSSSSSGALRRLAQDLPRMSEDILLQRITVESWRLLQIPSPTTARISLLAPTPQGPPGDDPHLLLQGGGGAGGREGGQQQQQGGKAPPPRFEAKVGGEDLRNFILGLSEYVAGEFEATESERRKWWFPSGGCPLRIQSASQRRHAAGTPHRLQVVYPNGTAVDVYLTDRELWAVIDAVDLHLRQCPDFLRLGRPRMALQPGGALSKQPGGPLSSKAMRPLGQAAAAAGRLALAGASLGVLLLLAGRRVLRTEAGMAPAALEPTSHMIENSGSFTGKPGTSAFSSASSASAEAAKGGGGPRGSYVLPADEAVSGSSETPHTETGAEASAAPAATASPSTTKGRSSWWKFWRR